MLSTNNTNSGYVLTIRDKQNNNLLSEVYLLDTINKEIIRDLFELDDYDPIVGSYLIVTIAQQHYFDSLLPFIYKLNYDKFNVRLECNNNSINVQYRNLTLIEFDKELKDIINFEYKLTETRGSYCAVFRTLGFGIGWVYDLLNKTYKCVELRDNGLGNRTVFKGLGLTAKEAYNNRK